jgi:hypothetical protein
MSLLPLRKLGASGFRRLEISLPLMIIDRISGLHGPVGGSSVIHAAAAVAAAALSYIASHKKRVECFTRAES